MIELEVITLGMVVVPVPARQLAWRAGGRPSIALMPTHAWGLTILRSFGGGGVQGRYDLISEETFIDYRSLAAGAAAAPNLMPAVSVARILRWWSGLEGTTRDHLPVIGSLKAAKPLCHVFDISADRFRLVRKRGAAVVQMVMSGLVPKTLVPFSAGSLSEGGKAA